MGGSLAKGILKIVLPASLRCLLLQLTEFLPIALQKFSV
jgi:hypothetical protein